MIDAAKYIGKRFAWGGRGPEVFDCYGLAQAIYRDLGIVLPEVESANERSLIHGLIHEGEELFEKLPQPAPGAIVTFAIHPRFVTHIGVVLDDSERFIHITKKISASVARLYSPEWRGRVRGFYRWRG